MSIIETIKAEVERRKKQMVDASYPSVIKKTRISELSIVLDILDDIQERTENPIVFDLQEQPIKVGDKVSIIKKKEGIVTRISNGKARVEMGDTMEIVALSDLVPEQPVCEGLEDAVTNYIAPIENEDGLKVINFSGQDIKDAFIAGASWQKEQMISALKNDGELPVEFVDKFHEIDRNAFKNGKESVDDWNEEDDATIRDLKEILTSTTISRIITPAQESAYLRWLIGLEKRYKRQ